MGDPINIRLNDARDPSRLDHFTESLRVAAQSGNQVLRNLADAYNRFVREHGHGPGFPVILTPLPRTTAAPKTKRPAPSPKKPRRKKSA